MTRAPIPEGHGREGSSFHRSTAETGNAQREDGWRGVWHLPVLAGLSLRLAVPARGREMSLPILPVSPGGSPPLQAASALEPLPVCVSSLPSWFSLTFPPRMQPLRAPWPSHRDSSQLLTSHCFLMHFSPLQLYSVHEGMGREKRNEHSELCLGKKCFLFCGGLL